MIKKFWTTMLLVVVLLCIFSGCSDAETSTYVGVTYPSLKYQNSRYDYDILNKTISLDSGFVLDNGHSYDIVETENGYDMILHFVETKQ